ncbi:hypothetical protein GCM10009809_29620 [Isoptericola hypogeus]|uniref:DUF4352 domain-containing protein n=1 Tax=Isoptericola hypogeus TaxID=300179 RepID=A0ABP4VMT3_9MICO
MGALAAVVTALVVVFALTGRTAPDDGAAADPSPGATTSASPDDAPTGEASSEPTGSAGPDGDDAPADDGPESGTKAPPPEKATTGPAEGAVDDEATVDADGRVVQAPIEYDEVSAPLDDVSVAAVKIEKVEGQANLPGEIGGPSLRFTVEVDNGTDEAMDLRTVVANAFYGPDRTPAVVLLKPGAKPFPQEAGAGDSARGVFVFNVPVDERGDVRLEVDLGVGAEIVAFEGAIS